MFRYGRSYAETLPLGQFRQGVQGFRFFFAVCFQGETEPLVDLFPTGDKHRFSFSGELVSCTGKYRNHGFVLMGCGYRAEQFGADKVHQLAFTLGKTNETLLYKFGRGDDGVVVGDFRVIEHLLRFQ